ncbi:5-methylcytosine-specific restriction endonuclease system specificity protein McrC [Burkholderia sp. Ax-1719]|uniref:5-methylcytosine-specific restriction endonuclease system specificity protein McrC n=1 Tax=Burkholderia sp. Ax-1719 TaxID=2608334 RepID=UPI00141F94D6|nr:5-methylcytosine-specific restriction endonuclease system specificity protein McrC [Burkholderia sp. Ax-1719]NIE63143.1 5-methylcytosine-specific restriction endonuclease system specificity protein McrC [Burkholderia sp. Ax-1719]
MSKSIPVKNLWFLLSYAHNLAEFSSELPVEVADEDDLPELLGRLLAWLVERRIRRNLTRAYQAREARLTRVRGRIDLVQTLCSDELRQGRIVCRFEEPTADTPRNQLVRYALTHAASSIGESKLSQRCRQMAHELARLGVSYRRPSRSELAREQFGRNDAEDRALLVVAGLVLDPRLPTEEAGNSHLARLRRDDRLLPYIFEKAVAGFYLHQLPAREWRVRPQKRLSWQVDTPTPGLHNLLPGMQADLILDSGISDRRIVIDTKFKAILRRNQFGSEKFRSADLYQLYTYLRTQTGAGDKYADEAEGILLHPSLGEHVDEACSVQGHRLRFTTVDLGGEPATIGATLRSLLT